MTTYTYTNKSSGTLVVGQFLFGIGETKTFGVTQPVMDAAVPVNLDRYVDGVLDNNPFDEISGINSVGGLVAALGTKQPTLVSGTNIKTLGGQSILGSGDLAFGMSSKYKLFAPGQQFIGSGSAVKDRSPNAADATFMASLTEANAYANPGYFTTGAGVNLGLAVPAAKVAFDLSQQSVIFSFRLKKAATASNEAFLGCADATSIQGFYLSMRASVGGVSKVRPVITTSTGAVTTLADSTAAFGEASATDHVLTMAIDSVTKGIFLYCDGTLSNSYANAFTGTTTLSVPLGFGAGTGTSGVTTVAGQFSGVHMLVMSGGLPINMGLVAQKLAGAPHLYLTDADMVF